MTWQAILSDWPSCKSITIYGVGTEAGPARMKYQYYVLQNTERDFGNTFAHSFEAENRVFMDLNRMARLRHHLHISSFPMIQPNRWYTTLSGRCFVTVSETPKTTRTQLSTSEIIALSSHARSFPDLVCASNELLLKRTFEIIIITISAPVLGPCAMGATGVRYCGLKGCGAPYARK